MTHCGKLMPNARSATNRMPITAATTMIQMTSSTNVAGGNAIANMTQPSKNLPVNLHLPHRVAEQPEQRPRISQGRRQRCPHIKALPADLDPTRLEHIVDRLRLHESALADDRLGVVLDANARPLRNHWICKPAARRLPAYPRLGKCDLARPCLAPQNRTPRALERLRQPV